MSIIFGAARGISKLAETVSNTTNEADRNEKTNATSENKNCLKKVIITEECMACGLCLGKSDLIVESEDGRVKCSKQHGSRMDYTCRLFCLTDGTNIHSRYIIKVLAFE